ncbi:MAG: 1-deoxy-D-xylulose-5-phosphate reductoisomerase [Clostridia bacterium]|nr:1-deoxy-D-xylulose-5-phosphate reductoisomerase [Clostridia bacterium]
MLKLIVSKGKIRDMSEKKRIVILGSTGSIGKQALSVVEKYPDNFKVVGLSAHTNEALLQKQIQEFKPNFYHFKDGAQIQVQTSLFDLLDSTEAKVVDSLDDLAKIDCDLLICAVSGIVGLKPVICALEKGINVAIATKEAIVSGGDIMNEICDRTGAKLIPIDSEHSALWQCLWGEDSKHIKKLIITASGGALRNMTKEEIKFVTAKEALNHPVWKMGKKVTIDSATLFNKGLEVVEASKLFRIDANCVSVLVHPESIVHGLVEFSDNSLKASLATPDMHLPIELAMFYPERAENSVKTLDLVKLGSLNFEKPDFDRFPCLSIVLEGMKKGNGAMTALSAADEILVEQFLNEEIMFYDISSRLEKVLKKFGNEKANTIDEIFGIDKATRQYTLKLGAK